VSVILRSVIGLTTIIMLGGFIGAFAAHILLQFQIDHRRVKEETGQPGWKILGSILAPMEFYKDDAKIIWRIRRAGFAAFAISVGVIAIVLLVASIVGIPVT
jgi:hypothetical protein